MRTVMRKATIKKHSLPGAGYAPPPQKKAEKPPKKWNFRKGKPHPHTDTDVKAETGADEHAASGNAGTVMTEILENSDETWGLDELELSTAEFSTEDNSRKELEELHLGIAPETERRIMKKVQHIFSESDLALYKKALDEEIETLRKEKAMLVERSAERLLQIEEWKNSGEIELSAFVFRDRKDICIWAGIKYPDGTQQNISAEVKSVEQAVSWLHRTEKRYKGRWVEFNSRIPELAHI